MSGFADPAAFGSQVAVSNQDDDNLSLFGLTSGTPAGGAVIPTTLSLAAASNTTSLKPTAMVAANGLLYVIESNLTNQITVVSPAANLVLGPIAVGATAGAKPVALTATPDGSTVYVASSDNTVTAIATASNTVTATLQVTTSSTSSVFCEGNRWGPVSPWP